MEVVGSLEGLDWVSDVALQKKRRGRRSRMCDLILNRVLATGEANAKPRFLVCGLI